MPPNASTLLAHCNAVPDASVLVRSSHKRSTPLTSASFIHTYDGVVVDSHAVPLTGRSTGQRLAPGTVSAGLAVVWTLVAFVSFAYVPVYSTSSGGETSDGTPYTTTGQATLAEHEGAGVLVVLLVPVAVAFMGLVGAAFRAPVVTGGAAGIIMALCILGMASIGVFYLPAGGLLVVAAVRAAGGRTSDARDRRSDGGVRWRSFLVAICLSWAVVGAIVAVAGLRMVNADAVLLAGAASVLGPTAAVAAAVLLTKGHPRLAGAALLLSVVTPTYAAWVVNLPALFIGLGLLISGSPVVVVGEQQRSSTM